MALKKIFFNNYVMINQQDVGGNVNSQFHEAANGKEALELMKNSWIDIVMTDYNMPVMNGLELIQTIKKEDLLKDIPVVVISTEGNAAKIKEFMDSGAAGYITKPFTGMDLNLFLNNRRVPYGP